MGMRFVQAQVPSMACPIPLPGPTWINESASSLGSTGTFTFSTDVEIDGAFTVDVGTFTFNGAEVTVVSGGDIFVNPGCTLRVINGTVITNVQNLWNGITVSPGGYLDIIDSDVCGSINAVYASNGYSSTPAEFMDSHIAAPNPATVSNGLYTFLAAAHRSGLVHDKVQVLLGQTNIAAFAQVQDSWNQGNVDSAIALLNSLAPINTSETLLQEVWGIRLEHANSSPGAAWSEEQAQALSEIAYQDLGEAGSAAILAQSLLGLTLLPNDWYPADPEERMASELPAKTSIYPNPAQTVVYLEAGTEAANATIADLQGQVKLMIRLESETTTTLDISNLAQGIYIVQIRKDSGSSESYKLFITR